MIPSELLKCQDRVERIIALCASFPFQRRSAPVTLDTPQFTMADPMPAIAIFSPVVDEMDGLFDDGPQLPQYEEPMFSDYELSHTFDDVQVFHYMDLLEEAGMIDSDGEDVSDGEDAVRVTLADDDDDDDDGFSNLLDTVRLSKASWPRYAPYLSPCFDQRKKPAELRFYIEHLRSCRAIIRYVKHGGDCDGIQGVTAKGKKHLLHLRALYFSGEEEKEEKEDDAQGAEDTSTSSSSPADAVSEADVQKELEEETGRGHTTCKYGVIDVLTDDTIIEIKCWGRAVDAIRQVSQYSLCYPDKKKRIHLFGPRPSATQVEKIQKLCAESGIAITERAQ